MKSHGLTNTLVYKRWIDMKYRCDNEKCESFKYYGGRGITYSTEWVIFENFYKDMGECLEGLTLDRIDPNGNYSKENCRWLSTKLQNRNRRKFCNNTSGKTGVVMRERNGEVRFIARWYDEEGNSKSKSFSLKQYGCQAEQLAKTFRENQIKGLGYGATHGK